MSCFTDFLLHWIELKWNIKSAQARLDTKTQFIYISTQTLSRMISIKFNEIHNGWQMWYHSHNMYVTRYVTWKKEFLVFRHQLELDYLLIFNQNGTKKKRHINAASLWHNKILLTKSINNEKTVNKLLCSNYNHFHFNDDFVDFCLKKYK